MEVAGSILDEVIFFLVKADQITAGSRAGSIPDELREKKNGTVQPVHLGYVHLLLHTFSMQLICLGYFTTVSFKLISGAAIF